MGIRNAGTSAARAIMLIALLFSFVSVRADEAAEILERVRETYDDIDDARILFSQSVSFERTGLEQRSSGTLYLKKDDHYRLEMGDRTVVTDGNTVWSYSQSTKQFIIDNFEMDERSLSPEKVLTGAPENFGSSIIGPGESADQIVLKLTPRDDHSFLTGMKLWIDEDGWTIKKVELTEFSGKKTVYQIVELETNLGLGKDLFVFSPPEGAEVVDLR
ncbi:MAG: outer membrane lipoprotein carrier protein LolA [Ignavibacteria bacterium]|nr:outer membrane lipoprotein carrier protein LolA [Ignavibacteria bacterium]